MGQKPLTEKQLVERLRERYGTNEWSFFPQVREATGYNKRSADGIAMNMYESRGLVVYGFECKSSRGDFLRELKQPEKAEGIFGYCDGWWLVVGDESIVKDGELPPTWGLLVPRGDKFFAKKAAPKLQPKPLDRGFIAALLRAAWAYQPPPKALTEAQERKLARIEQLENEKRHAEDDAKRLRESIAAFEAVSGVELDQYNGERLGNYLRIGRLLSANHDWRIEPVIESLRKTADNLSAANGLIKALQSGQPISPLPDVDEAA